jgi:electron transfer flavoprotein alpha subunit
MEPTIVVVAEARAGKLKKASLEALSAATDLAGKAGGQVVAILPGSGLDEAGSLLAKGGASKVVLLDESGLANYSGDGYCQALLARIQVLAPAAVLMAHTAMGKDLMPRIAAKLQTGLVSDVTGLVFEAGKFVATKPVYAGKAYAKVAGERAPFLATTRPNNFEAKLGASAGAIEKQTAGVDPASFRSLVTEIVAGSSDRVPLQEAKVVVSGGRGLKGAEHFHLIEELAAAFGPGVASVGASRAIVDLGWRPHREQVGQTGKVVAPTLYIAVGISGAIQHVAGMRTAKTIVAINKDPEAPIFKLADYGIVGDVFEVLPPLIAAVKQAVGH